MSYDTGTLDTLCARAQAGDGRAEAELFSHLRVRFLQLAKRRVQSDHIEDVVQEALKIVCDRYRERKQGVGILVWALTVLRHVIGNHYQKRETERRYMEFVEEYPRDAATTDDPLALPMGAESRRILSDSLAELSRRFPRCGRIFGHLLKGLEQGGSPQELTTRTLAAMQNEEPGLARGAFYTALHRCRSRLRIIWDRSWGGTDHA